MAEKIFNERVSDKTKNLTSDELIIKDPADTQRQMKIILPNNIPSNGIPQERKYIIRENIADYVNMNAPQTASFTATWGGGYRVDATSGNIIITIPEASTTNEDNFIQIHRIDVSVNTVTIIIQGQSQRFFQLLGGTDADGFTLKTGQTVNLRSIGTAPVVTNYAGVESVSRLWLPTDISGLSIWLKDSGLPAEGLMSVWNDSSGNGNNLTSPSSDIEKPSHVASVLNGLPVARFGGNDILMNSSFRLTANGTSSVMSVFKFSDSVHVGHIIQFGQAGTLSNSLGFRGQSPGNHLRTYVWGRSDADSPTLTANTFNIGGYVKNGTFATTFLNGVGGSQVAQGAADIQIGVAVGARNDRNEYLTGDIAEIILYNSALSTSNREIVEGYLAWRFGLVGNLASTHPYKNIRPLKVLRTF